MCMCLFVVDITIAIAFAVLVMVSNAESIVLYKCINHLVGPIRYSCQNKYVIHSCIQDAVRQPRHRQHHRLRPVVAVQQHAVPLPAQPRQHAASRFESSCNLFTIAFTLFLRGLSSRLEAV